MDFFHINKNKAVYFHFYYKFLKIKMINWKLYVYVLYLDGFFHPTTCCTFEGYLRDDFNLTAKTDKFAHEMLPTQSKLNLALTPMMPFHDDNWSFCDNITTVIITKTRLPSSAVSIKTYFG